MIKYIKKLNSMPQTDTQLAIKELRHSINKEHIRNQAEHIFDLLDVSETTRQDYKARIRWFIDFTSEQGITRDSFVAYKRFLRERTCLSVATKNKYLATARVCLKELNRQGALPTDITQNVKVFKQNKKHKREGLNQREIQAITERLKELAQTPTNSRVRALFCLLALQGLRQIEIKRLNVEDIDVVSKRAFIQGKGQDDKEVIYLHPETVKTIKEYLQVSNVSSGALFQSFSNRRSERITTMTIKRSIKLLFDELGIEKTTHGFRHYYTTTLLKKLKDISIVRKFTRHKSLEMLVVYDDELDIQHRAGDVFRCFEGMGVTV